MASISWIVAFTAPALYAVEAELEEDCLLLTGPIGSMWHVTLRRSLGGIVAAGLIVAVQTAGEMAVTDLLQVRTYAETIYTEFALASRVGAATATAIPGLFVWCVLVAAAGILLVRYVPQNTQALFARRPEFKLPIGRWLVLLACVIVVAATLGVPITSLVWRTGLKFPSLTARPNVPNSPRAQPNDPAISADDLKPHWSAASFRKNVLRSFESASDQLILSLKVAAATAVIVVPSAWLLITLAQSSSVGQSIFAGLAAVLFAMPGPVLGIGLKLASGQASNWLNDTASLGGRLNNWSEAWNQVTAIGWVAELPPAILVWLHSLRSLPFVLAVLWPMRRLVNRRLLEAARIDGAGAWARFRFVELPACRPGLMAALLIAAVISLGELSGSVMVTPPGQQPLSVRIFTLAHYGLESHLAGICLLLLAVSTAGALSVMACVYWSLRTLRD
jgi:ABC-type Fe3+ transport system permease subunit